MGGLPESPFLARILIKKGGLLQLKFAASALKFTCGYDYLNFFFMYPSQICYTRYK